MIEAVFFDLDGTLLNTAPDIQVALNAALLRHGYDEIDYAHTLKYIGNGARRLVERALPDGGDVEAVLNSFGEIYATCDNSFTQPYDGMSGLLMWLKERGLKLAVITNKLQAATEKVMNQFFPGIFDFVGGDSGMFPCKPDPSYARYAGLTLRVPPRSCVFVGDGETDVLTARNAGMVGVSVLWGYRSREVLEKAGAKMFALNVEELKEILEKIS